MTRQKIIAGILVFLAAFAALSFIFFGDKGRGAGTADSGEKLGVIYIEGIIAGGAVDSFLGGIASSEAVMKHIREAAEDPTVKAVVLRIDSPGGTVPATQEIAREIEKLKEKGKIVVASMGDTGTSGAYWIAAKAHKIFANPGTITGSIGVRMDYQNLERLYEKLGIESEVIKSGPYKDMGSPTRELGAEERKMLQEMVDEMLKQFIDAVAEGRKISKEKAAELANGRIWTGSQALKLGLIDELGNYYDAIREAAEMAGIRGEPVIKVYGKTGLLEAFFGGFSQSSGKLGVERFQWLLIQKTLGPVMLLLPEELQ
ncbi:MAG: Signal peptide peptidase SppA, 36K type [Clostridia bacterium 41_269]|nr:MAG: Signal peptide peptidase SppA, 36K type [Clostridia bacterium 41_269]